MQQALAEQRFGVEAGVAFGGSLRLDREAFTQQRLRLAVLAGADAGLSPELHRIRGARVSRSPHAPADFQHVPVQRLGLRVFLFGRVGGGKVVHHLLRSRSLWIRSPWE